MGQAQGAWGPLVRSLSRIVVRLNSRTRDGSTLMPYLPWNNAVLETHGWLQVGGTPLPPYSPPYSPPPPPAAATAATDLRQLPPTTQAEIRLPDGLWNAATIGWEVEGEAGRCT